MCGICGFTGFRNDKVLHRMTDIIKYRGPDGRGYYISDEVSLGICRLAIIDLKTGDQPIYNEDKSIAVIFNGEIYNYLELRKKLELNGHRFYTTTDTEVIVHLYEDYKEGFVNHICGMFAIAIWDQRERKLLLVRDRLGIKPLFYTKLPDGNIVFASEIKSILLHPWVSKEINLSALDSYFTFLYIPQPETIYKNIFHLPPAHYLVWKNREIQLKKYWKLEIKNEELKNKNEKFYLEKLEELLKYVIKEHLIGDVPIGVFLSGGLDSSTICVFTSQVTPKINSFTIGYSSPDEAYNELKKAQIVAKILNTNHKEFVVTPEVVKLLTEIVLGFSQPFADSSAVPTYLVSKVIRENCKVALTGIGGDELFCGYPRYLGMKIASILPTIKIPRMFIKLLPESYTADNPLGRIKRFLYGLKFPMDDRYISFISYLSREDKLEFYSDKFLSFLNNQRGNQLHKHYFNSFPSDELLNKILFADINTYLCDDLLLMADRMSMLNSLELRVPFCDHRVVEFVASVPAELRLKGMTLKYLLRRLMSKYLPKEIVNQKKMGFMIPIARWLRDELKNNVEKFIKKKEYSDYFQYEFIERMWSEHISGKRNFSDQLWSLLVFDAWKNVYQIELPDLKKKYFGVKKPKIQAKKILVVNLGGIGDIIMSSPIIKLLRDYYQNAEICLLTIPRSLELSKNFAEIDKFYTIPLRYRFIPVKFFIETIKTIRLLRNERFDLLINLRAVETFAGMIKMLLFAKLLNAKISIGRNLSNLGFFYTIPIKEQKYAKNSEVELTLNLLKPLGIEAALKEMYINYQVSSQSRSTIDKYLSEFHIEKQHLLIGLNPGAFRPSRRWPVGHWRDLIKLINTKYRTKIFITGEKSEVSIAKEIAFGYDNVFVTNGLFSLDELAALIERLNVFITNDSGPMHLAAAVGTKLIGIFGPGDVDRFTPYVPKEKYRIVRKENIKCVRPCYKFKCKHPTCLIEISPEEVFNTMCEIIS